MEREFLITKLELNQQFQVERDGVMEGVFTVTRIARKVVLHNSDTNQSIRADWENLMRTSSDRRGRIRFMSLERAS